MTVCIHGARMDKKSSSSQNKAPSPATRRSTPWHAVSVVTGRWCCEEARHALGTRFLSRDAPRLPLTHCASPESCACSYRHHIDRRGQPRRRDDAMGLRRVSTSANDRRLARGRRADD